MVRFTAIKHVRTYMEIVEQISRMIRNEELLPGEKLPSERALSAELGIGRQCLREALSVLEVLGLIEVKKGRGTFVREDAFGNLTAKDLDIEEVGDPFALLEARKALEPHAAFLAAKLAQPKDINEMDEILGEMAAVLTRGEHASAQDKRLHVVIARASRNPVFHKLMNEIIANMGKPLWLTLKEKSLQVHGRNERYHEEHVKLVEAIKQQDSRLAEKIMIQHLHGIEQDLRY
ncbi:MAG: GntR family transcriptional regulator [Anaerosporomusa subterranea]|nr:GntR family transcriptional regulator [Anaerosporomusa subterranea]